MRRWRAHVFFFFFFFFSSVSWDLLSAKKLLGLKIGGSRKRQCIFFFFFNEIVMLVHMGKHLRKPDGTLCSSLNHESPFSELTTEVRNNVTDCYKPKMEPVPVPRKSISGKTEKNQKPTSLAFQWRTSNSAYLKWFTQSCEVRREKEKKRNAYVGF